MRGADDHPARGERRIRHRAGDPEIGDEDAAVAIDEDVAALHVAMDDPRSCAAARPAAAPRMIAITTGTGSAPWSR